MLFLLFKANEESYAIAAREVREVVPRVTLRACPGVPDYVAGLFNYRGAVVPVIDLTRLLAPNRAASPVRLSTRIVLAPYRARDGRSRLIGVMAEKVTQTIEKDNAEFAQEGVFAEGAPFLGALCRDGVEMIQRICLEEILPREIETILFAECASSRDEAEVPSPTSE